jgi:hypothetical protein
MWKEVKMLKAKDAEKGKIYYSIDTHEYLTSDLKNWKLYFRKLGEVVNAEEIIALNNEEPKVDLYF